MAGVTKTNNKYLNNVRQSNYSIKYIAKKIYFCSGEKKESMMNLI